MSGECKWKYSGLQLMTGAYRGWHGFTVAHRGCVQRLGSHDVQWMRGGVDRGPTGVGRESARGDKKQQVIFIRTGFSEPVVLMKLQWTYFKCSVYANLGQSLYSPLWRNCLDLHINQTLRCLIISFYTIFFFCISCFNGIFCMHHSVWFEHVRWYKNKPMRKVLQWSRSFDIHLYNVCARILVCFMSFFG